VGYTHYIYRRPALPAAPFSAWVADVRVLVVALPAAVIIHPEHTPPGRRSYPLRLAGPTGSGDPILAEELVACNGAAPHVGDPFVIPRILTPTQEGLPDAAGRLFTCCKTGALPYDLLVTAALIRLQHLFPNEILVASDGGPPSWEAGCTLCERVFGEARLPRDVAERAR
jgi:hypothetical protein